MYISDGRRNRGRGIRSYGKVAPQSSRRSEHKEAKLTTDIKTQETDETEDALNLANMKWATQRFGEKPVR